MEGHFVEEDVLYRRTFCIGRFVWVDVLWKDVPWKGVMWKDVL